jgi:flagellar protein FliL
MAAAENEEESTPETAAPKKNKILPLILVANALLLTGILIFVMKRPSAQAAGGGKEHAASKEHDEPAAEEEHGEKGESGEKGEHGAEAEGLGPTIRLDNFIVQVQAIEGDRYVHMTIEVEVGAESDKKRFEMRMPRIRDAVIGYLADRNEDELRGSEGLAHTKEALSKKIDDMVPGHRVRGLFITEFIIQ